MGDSPTIPWRLLDIEILVEDHETGGKFHINIIVIYIFYVFLKVVIFKYLWLWHWIKQIL